MITWFTSRGVIQCELWFLVDVDESVTVAAASEKKATREHNKTELVVTDVGPNFNCLWSYQCSTTRGHNVSCIGWNSTNPVSTPQKLGRFSLSVFLPFCLSVSFFLTFFLTFFLSFLRGGTCPLHGPVLRLASRAGPIRNLRGGTTVVWHDTIRLASWCV